MVQLLIVMWVCSHPAQPGAMWPPYIHQNTPTATRAQLIIHWTTVHWKILSYLYSCICVNITSLVRSLRLFIAVCVVFINGYLEHILHTGCHYVRPCQKQWISKSICLHPLKSATARDIETLTWEEPYFCPTSCWRLTIIDTADICQMGK